MTMFPADKAGLIGAANLLDVQWEDIDGSMVVKATLGWDGPIAPGMSTG